MNLLISTASLAYNILRACATGIESLCTGKYSSLLIGVPMNNSSAKTTQQLNSK